MPDTAIDIIDLLHDIDPQRITYIAQSDRVRYHAAIKALVAERDKLVEDNASHTYKGNSVRYWHDKASAYKATIGSLWEILDSAAVRPDGERTITAALTTLVAERDELRDVLSAQIEGRDALVAERDALRERVAVGEMQLRAERRDAHWPAASDLRARLVCAIWPVLIQQWREYKDAIDPRGCARSDALEEADKMVAAMRRISDPVRDLRGDPASDLDGEKLVAMRKEATDAK